MSGDVEKEFPILFGDVPVAEVGSTHVAVVVGGEVGRVEWREVEFVGVG